MVVDVFLVVGLVTVQVIFAACSVLIYRLLFVGLSYFFLIIYGSLATAIFLLPFAICIERSKWPRKFNPALLLQLTLIAFGGVTAFQGLVLLGIRNTSPTIGSAMPNLAPGIIFLLAWCLGYEKVDLRITHSRVKIVGTLVCLGGAIMMSCMQRASNFHPFPHGNAIHQNTFMGCIYLLVPVVLLSGTMILQAATLKEFPAPITMSFLTALIGALLTALMELTVEGKLELHSDVLPLSNLVFYSLSAGAVNGLCIAFHAWAIKTRGPVFVSIFNPIGTVCTVVISAIKLGQSVTTGSLAGMILMFVGLYLVLWAKSKEEYVPVDDGEKGKPLLS